MQALVIMKPQVLVTMHCHAPTESPELFSFQNIKDIWHQGKRANSKPMFHLCKDTSWLDLFYWDEGHSERSNSLSSNLCNEGHLTQKTNRDPLSTQPATIHLSLVIVSTGFGLGISVIPSTIQHHKDPLQSEKPVFYNDAQVQCTHSAQSAYKTVLPYWLLLLPSSYLYDNTCILQCVSTHVGWWHLPALDDPVASSKEALAQDSYLQRMD